MLFPKPEFDEFVKTCTPLLVIPELEKKMRLRVREIVARLFAFEAGQNPAENIKRFLREDEDFLGVLCAMSGLSQEKFLRIISAERFAQEDFGAEWGRAKIVAKMRNDDAFAEKIAALFLEGKDNALLAGKVANFYLDQLSLAENWTDAIQNQGHIARFVRQKLMGEYADKKGDFVEEKIISVMNETGVPHEKGQAPLLGKEADCAAPSLADPRVVVMSSYLETTSSSQTIRANEQRDMYLKIQGDNQRYPSRPARVLVNVVDGGGWLARRSDLKKMHAGCDYVLNINTLGQLAEIVRHHAGEE